MYGYCQEKIDVDHYWDLGLGQLVCKQARLTSSLHKVHWEGFSAFPL